MTREHFINLALKAIDDVVHDNSCSLKETIESLEEIRDEIDTWIESIKNDIDALEDQKGEL